MMNDFVSNVLQKARINGLIPCLNDYRHLPLPAVNKVELYLSFYGNDRCAHCISCSGPDRKELMHPDTASIIVQNISRYSILAALENMMGGGGFRFKRPQRCRELDITPNPPAVLTDSLILAYCCLCVGDYGDLVSNPEQTPMQILKDPIPLMLRKGKTEEEFLNLASGMDPSIKVFGNCKHDRATGSTCYQILSGERYARGRGDYEKENNVCQTKG